MVNIRSVNEIIQSLQDFFRLSQPDLDIKPGTVARDLFIEAPASQVSILYDELSGVSTQQSFRLVVGSDLDKLAKNYGIIRKQSTPATGTALLTFSSINSPININRGDKVTANNGISFAISAGTAVIPANLNFYRSIASKFRDQLDTAGITDEFAVQVSVIAVTAGTAGNIGSFALSKTTISGVTNVTNVNAFLGGTDQENDASFRNRVLSSFSGSSVGTTLGYLNIAKGTSGVSDAFIVSPGDALMTRDGTVVETQNDGSNVIISEGSGGKVDIIILGSNLIENKDSFIYRDKSNNNDPTSIKNNIVLGQIIGDENKTINRKRIDNLKNGTLPAQPVNTILEVTGSISGANFLPKTVDFLGRIFGNYELIKDTGPYSGSPWGFDTFHWISDRISLFNEDRIKGQFNGQDTTTFIDVLNIPKLQQNISIVNENSIVTFDRSIIQLIHTPATNVTRVFNINTGERYVIVDQNIDKTGTFNNTGRIKISGNTLPSPSDQLQVDYNWIVDYDQYLDYDGLHNTLNPRSVTDSIDWGYASVIKNELVNFTKDLSNGFFTGTISHPTNNILSVNSFSEINGVVKKVTSGIFINRLSVVLNNLKVTTQTIDSIYFTNTNKELYVTAQNDGTFNSITTIIGIDIFYSTTIILPTDTIANDGDRVTVILNSLDIFHGETVTGSVNGFQVTIPNLLISDITTNNLLLKVTYIADVNDLLSIPTTALPISRNSNSFLINNSNGFNNFSIVNISRRENQIVQKNNSNQIYVELNLSVLDFILSPSSILSVIRLSDNKQLWDSNNIGTIITGTSGNYQLILNGVNTPLIGDQVLIIYYANDTKKFQPFSYANRVITHRIDLLTIDPGTGKLSLPLNHITSQPSNVQFDIIKPNSDIIINSFIDGILISSGDSATLTSPSFNFATLPDLLNQQIRIKNATSDVVNNRIYQIIAYNSSTNLLTITNVLDKITADQICIIKIADGQEVWNYQGVIDIANNKLLLAPQNTVKLNDHVYIIIFNVNVLRKSATKIIGTTVDQIINTGVITITGTTLFKVNDIIFTATNTGLKLNVGEAFRKFLNLSSTSSLPSNVRIVRISKLEKVLTASITNDEVLKVLTSYDLKNTILKDNLLFLDEMLNDITLQNFDFILPTTLNNILNDGTTQNLPILGDKMRVTFYYTVDNDTENLSYTRNGTLYTNKKFALINKIYLSSGFKSSQSTKFTATSFTQPSLGSRYKVFYDYIAPKPNERIVIRDNYNKLVSDVTFNLESNRPINADVLVRQARKTLLDLTMNVVIAEGFQSSAATVLQNLRDKLIAAMTTIILGDIVDTVTLINIAQSVKGIARARILYFNKTGNPGQVLSVQAQQDEYLISNNVIINTETR